MAEQNNLLIFVVDDDLLQREMLKDHLSKKSNYTVRAFTSGEECIEHIAEHPSIVFLDYNLNSANNKAKDGISVLKEIKRLQPKIEVVMFSGQEKIEVAVNSVTHGAFDYIVKSESAFLRAENVIKNILKRHTLLKENKLYKMLTTALIVLVAVMIIGAFAAYALGYISDKQVGGDIVG